MPEDPETEARLRALEQRMETVADEATAARHLASFADHDIAELATKEQVARLDARLSTRIDELSDRLGSVGARVDGLGAQVEGLGARVDGLGAQVEGLGARVDGLGAEVEGLGARVDGLGAEVEGLGARVDGLGAQIEGLGARVDGLDVRVDANTRVLNALSQQTAERFTQLGTELRTGMGAIITRLDGLIEREDRGNPAGPDEPAGGTA